MTHKRDSNRRDQPVSLHGLDPEDALRALLAVKPDDEPARESPNPEESKKKD